MSQACRFQFWYDCPYAYGNRSRFDRPGIWFVSKITGTSGNIALKTAPASMPFIAGIE